MRSRRLTVRTVLVLFAAISVAGIAVPAQASNDKHWAKLWNIRQVGGESGWAVNKGRGMTIAIADTGVDLKHEDLKDNLVPGYDFIDDDAVPMDDHGHGTHVAGIAAARVDNGLGVAGIAPEAKIMPVRVLATDGYSEGDSVEQGIRWATDHGADVINLSLGAGVLVENIFGRALTDAVNYAWSKGVIPVVVTGNDNFFRTEFDDANAMVVTATTSDDRLAEYATGAGFAKWGIAAPGGSASGDMSEMVYSALWSSSNKDVHYGYGAGTSMAAPHVSGAAAILRSLGFSPSDTVGRLLATAKDLGSRGPDGSYGSGRLDVAAAVAGLKAASADPPAGSLPATSQQSPPPPTPEKSAKAPARSTPNGNSTPAAVVEVEAAEPRVRLRRAAGAEESAPEGHGAIAYLAIGAAVIASGVSIAFLRFRRS